MSLQQQQFSFTSLDPTIQWFGACPVCKTFILGKKSDTFLHVEATFCRESLRCPKNHIVPSVPIDDVSISVNVLQ